MSGSPSSRQPLADQMYKVLFEQLMDGTRGHDGPLNIGALSREFNVSQTPLREALARLEHTGLVKREALKGYRLAPLLGEEEIEKLMEARQLLEPKLAHDAASRVTPEFLKELQAEVDALRQLSGSTSSEAYRAYWAADVGFHNSIAARSGNPFLEIAYQSLGGQFQRFQLLAQAGVSYAEVAAQEHAAIYDALARGDGDAASAAMYDHITNAGHRGVGHRRSMTESGS